MWRPVIRFCRDQRGTLLITEWIFLATILVIAVIPLTFTLRDTGTDVDVRSDSAAERGDAEWAAHR
jgi:hypothetical protein